MSVDSHMPWEWLLLSIITQRPLSLTSIYKDIEEQYKDTKAESGFNIIAPRLFEVDGRWGERPDYQHTVRSFLTGMVRNGLATRVDRGTYGITDAGRKRLAQY